MDFSFTPEEEAFREQVLSFLKEELSPEVRERHRDLTDYSWVDEELEHEFRRRVSASGLLGMGWPKEYGGQGKRGFYGPITAFEMARANAPGHFHGTRIIGPSIMLFGSEEQKRSFLPKIASGEVDFSLGYSEPGAGSDLANLQTRAVTDGDDFVITGQKIFTSGAHRADYCWMVARTNPNVPKHKGISIFLVPFKTPGITIRPLWTMAGWRHNEVFFDGARVPKSSLVGERDRGWYHLMTALDFERSGFLYLGGAQRLFEVLVKYCKSATRNGKSLAQDPMVRRELAQLKIELDAAMRLSKRVPWMQETGQSPTTESSMSKIWVTELTRRICQTGTRIMGLYGGLMAGSPLAPAEGQLAFSYLDTIRTTIAAGSNEVQRNIIAQRGLGMPR